MSDDKDLFDEWVWQEEFASERRDSSEQAFVRATYNLAAYSYRVRSDGDGP